MLYKVNKDDIVAIEVDRRGHVERCGSIKVGEHPVPTREHL
jgi:hypothetical protein